MADDKKNIPDTGKIDNPSEPGKVEPAKATPPVQEQPAPAKAETPKDKDAPAPSMEGAPQPGKDEKQATISGMGDPAPAGKVVDFTTAREGTAKGKPTEKAAAPDKDKQADKSKDAAKPQPRDKVVPKWSKARGPSSVPPSCVSPRDKGDCRSLFRIALEGGPHGRSRTRQGGIHLSSRQNPIHCHARLQGQRRVHA